MPRYQPSAFALGGAGSCLGWPVWTPGGSGGMKANAPAASLTRSFTDLLSAWPADDPALQDQCRLLLLDGLAVAVAGAAAERGPGLMPAQARSESPDGPSTVIGQGFATSVVNAARERHGDARARFRTNVESAKSRLLPASASAARAGRTTRTGRRRPQGRAVLRAIAKGVEAQGRLRLASGQIEPAKLSMHPPGAVGPLATALACGDMLGLHGERLAAAVGIASSRSGGLLANVGSMTKALHCGDAAANGVQAALLAAEGFTADADALGNARGWGASLFWPNV
jgi:aconitate decarboxylase